MKRPRFGLIESFVLVFSLFVGGELLFDYHESISENRRHAEQMFLQASRTVRAEFGQINEAAAAILKTAGAFRAASGLGVADLRSSNELLITFLSQFPFVSSVNFGDAAGNGFLLLRADAQWKNRIKKADEAGSVTWLILDERGKVVASNASKDDYDPRERPWYQAAIRQSGVAWSAPYLLRTTRDVGITASLQFDSGSGSKEVAGVDIMLKDLSHFLAGVTADVNGMSAHLISQDGTVIACSEIDQFLSRLKRADAALPRIDDGGDPSAAAAIAARKGAASFWPFTLAGKRFLAAAVAVSFSADRNFTMVLTVPEDALGGDFARAAFWKLALFSLLLAAASAWYIFRYLIPLRRVATVIRDFGAGKVGSLAAEAVRRDEIGALATEFSGMVHTLAERDSMLRESKEKYKELFGSIVDVFYRTDTEGLLLVVSPSVEKLLGYAPAEVIGRSIGDVYVNPEERTQLISALREHGEIAGYEARLRAKDGSEVWVSTHAQWYRDKQGAILGVQGLSRDITERKRAALEVRRESDRAQRYLDMVETMIVALDSEGRITSINRKSCELLGWREEELLGQSWFAKCLPAPVGMEGVYPYFRRLMAGEVEPEEYFENPVLTRSGELREISWHGTLLRDEEGRITGILSSGEDITERKRAEAERGRLAVAIEQAGEAVIVTNAEGTIQYVNPVFEAVTGYSRAEAIGQNPRLLKSGEQGEEFYREMWQTITSGRVWKGRIVNRGKNGLLITEEATISPVRDGSGRIVNFVAVKRDVTEFLRAAEEKARLEDQLRQAQKVEAIGQLAGGVAHDFNNLTAIVLGYGEMLMDQLRPGDPARNSAEQIVAAGRRAAALTRQLLAFSRRQTLQPEVLDLNAVIQNLEKMLGRLIGENISLVFNLAAHLGRVTADPGQIEQVVTNLAVNARDAMPLGGRLTVETDNVELDGLYSLDHENVVPGRYVMLALTDTGSGFDKATMARIFEPFYTTKEKGKGTGLGLATVYGVVKQSSGYIYAYSEPGLGAAFKIYLPRTEAEPQPAAAEVEALRGAGERILVVEDEKALRELCASALTGLGYRVSVAAHGAEALLLVREKRFEPDLVVTDVIMPGISGAELSDQLRRDRPGLPVLYMSGYTDQALAPHGILAPGTPYIQKPFSMKTLAAKVQEMLAGKTAADSGAPPSSHTS
jgi:PAS domain S-box-containing protein